MDSICRLCALKSTDLTSIFALRRDRLLSDMIQLVCPVCIDAADDLPKFVCNRCLADVFTAIDLRERSVRSELHIREKVLASKTPKVLKILQNFEEDANGNDCSDLEQVIPMVPKLRKKTLKRHGNKYETVPDGQGKLYKCPYCSATFSFPTNTRRHVRKLHASQEREKAEENVKSCNDTSNQRTTPSSQKGVKCEHSTDSNSKSELTQKYVKLLNNQAGSEHIDVIGEEIPSTFTYKCALCSPMETKTFTQAMNNKSLSNFRRHLWSAHGVDVDTKEERQGGERKASKMTFKDNDDEEGGSYGEGSSQDQVFGAIKVEMVTNGKLRLVSVFGGI